MKLLIANYPIECRNKPCVNYVKSAFDSVVNEYDVVGRRCEYELLIDNYKINAADVVIIYGGESFKTLANNVHTRSIIDLMKCCKKYKKRLVLWNWVFHINAPFYRDLFSWAEHVIVRDKYSEINIKYNGIKRVLCGLDPCVKAMPGNKIIDFDNAIVAGDGSRDIDNLKLDYKIDIDDYPYCFEDVVATLQTSSGYVTENPYGMYAAIAAGIPFASSKSNNVEIISMLDTLGKTQLCAKNYQEATNVLRSTPKVDYSIFDDFPTTTEVLRGILSAY